MRQSIEWSPLKLPFNGTSRICELQKHKGYMQSRETVPGGVMRALIQPPWTIYGTEWNYNLIVISSKFGCERCVPTLAIQLTIFLTV